jgi:hypothetical protein
MHFQRQLSTETRTAFYQANNTGRQSHSIFVKNCVLSAYQAAAVPRARCLLKSVPRLINYPGQAERALKSAVLLHQLPDFRSLL